MIRPKFQRQATIPVAFFIGASMSNRNRRTRPDPDSIAARHMLPAEGFMGAYMVALAASGMIGGDGNGLLHRMLESMGMDNTWGLSFGLVGLLMFAAASVEWFYGRDWTKQAIAQIGLYRRIAAGSACAVWVVVVYVSATTDLHVFNSMMLLIPFNLSFSFYSLYENTRVLQVIEGNPRASAAL